MDEFHTKLEIKDEPGDMCPISKWELWKQRRDFKDGDDKIESKTSRKSRSLLSVKKPSLRLPLLPASDTWRVNRSGAPVYCAHCEKPFPNKRRLYKHLWTHREKLFSCGICGMAFPEKHRLTTHLRVHSSNKPYVCLNCEKRFREKKSLTRHVFLVHGTEAPYSCDQCGRRFKLLSRLEAHMVIHTGLARFSCSECDKHYAMNAALQVHMRKHRGERPYECLICGKRYAEHSTLKKHAALHSGAKPYRCEICSKACSLKSNLQNHLKTHKPDAPYSCSSCSKAFKTRQSLIYHERTHMGEKPFECGECGKCFTDRSTLTTHKKFHSGERPHECLQCGKRFTLKSSLKVHLETHRGILYGCRQCGKQFKIKSTVERHVASHISKNEFDLDMQNEPLYFITDPKSDMTIKDEDCLNENEGKKDVKKLAMLGALNDKYDDHSVDMKYNDLLNCVKNEPHREECCFENEDQKLHGKFETYIDECNDENVDVKYNESHLSVKNEMPHFTTDDIDIKKEQGCINNGHSYRNLVDKIGFFETSEKCDEKYSKFHNSVIKNEMQDINNGELFETFQGKIKDFCSGTR